jgi:putative ABC transport system permease protein
MLRATFRSLLARKLRLLLSAMAVVLGVSFVAGSLTLTDTLGRVFNDLFLSVNAKTDVEVRGPDVFAEGGNGPQAPVPADLLPRVAAVPGVVHVNGDVQGYAQVLDKEGKAHSTGGAPAFGIDYDPDPRTSTLTLSAGAVPAGSGEVTLDAPTAKATGYRLGDAVPVQLVTGLQRFTLVGTFGFGSSGSVGGASIVAFDSRTAQQLLGRPGEFQALRVAGDGELSQTELRDRIDAALPAEYEALTGEQSAEQGADDIQGALSFFTTFLLVFAAVALFVGAFLIFNTFTILVAQRQRELALLRALGASRRQVTSSVLVESVVVGAVASALGLGLGVLVALGLRALVNSFGAALPSGPLVVSLRTVLVSIAVGLGVTCLAALLPARKASAVPPVAAMRDAATPEASLRRTTVLGAVLLVAGVVGLAVGLSGELLVLGIGALLAFLGVAALSPLLSRPAAFVLGAPFARRLAGRLGRRNAMRNPRRTAATAAALMVGLALVSAVSVLGSSAKASVTKIVAGALAADLVVQSTGGGEGLSPSVGDELATLPQVGQVDRLRFDEAQVRDKVEFVTSVPAGALGRTVDVTRAAGDVQQLSPTTVLLSKSTAEGLAVSPGDSLPVRFARGDERTFTVGGTYVDNELVGSYLFESSVAEQFSGRLDGVLLVDARDGTSAAALRTAVDGATAAFPTAEVLDREEFTATAADQIDTVTNIINVLLLLSILIAVLGIVNTLALAVLERTRELGMLRAVGLARSQTRRMVTVEAVVVAVFGAVLGVVVGTAFGVAFQRALADQGVTELSIPTGRLLLFVAVAGLAGVVAALLPARRAARLDVLTALAAT